MLVRLIKMFHLYLTNQIFCEPLFRVKIFLVKKALTFECKRHHWLITWSMITIIKESTSKLLIAIYKSTSKYIYKLSTRRNHFSKHFICQFGVKKCFNKLLKISSFHQEEHLIVQQKCDSILVIIMCILNVIFNMKLHVIIKPG